MLFLAALALRVYRLDAQSLWLDEGSSWQMAGMPWGALLREMLSPTAAYPLYHLLLKAWVGVFGDSEIALRLPSAIAGAAAVPAIYLAGQEAGGGGQGAGARRYPLAAAAIMLISPFPLWYAQEAKAYSLLLLAAALLTWALLRALRTGAGRDWLAFGAVALVAVFVGWAASAGLALISAGLVAVMVYGLGSDRAATGAYIPAGPLSALGLTFTRFSLDRWPGDAPWWWLIPWAALLAWGLIGLFRDVWRGKGGARSAPTAIVCMLLVPMGLFLIQLLFTRLYEARYLIVLYPAWALAAAYPLQGDRGQGTGDRGQALSIAVLVAALGTGAASLFQPTFGLFSGAPVKEQYREAIAELAARVQPDDAVVIHPSYIRPLYDYYMGRLSADPAPQPLVFADFWQGETAYGQREWDIERRAKLAGYTRSFLLIAPEHARTVDAPAPGDEYGLVGNFWAFSREQRAWPCGIWRYNGAHLLCQEAPEAYITGARPEPATPVGATFGERLTLLGFTLKATTPDGPGVYRAGGNLPISLFWDVAAQPTEDLSFFLHLCRDCESPPVAGDDGPPLGGYLPTSSWLPGKPARDDRAIPLPRDLPPGRYTLLLGVYRPSDPSPSARLAVSGGEGLGEGRLVLETVEIVNGE
ncbi:glycosyltransferase family 39 protein [Oscillochloris sp. ZM17-4]|uniref:glycosyltransferase family 39 protein n=1 Tax=Oscillochloris sp. ZM17-4 TaxID=2866714 RepID=UPI001C734F94|nr:glycosyltransferase family 39 protein [Oscillochloris sp. ZM17-4]MBX0330748.1 glycosyltransferase family 39 protein [Oscillochloris sp. ZM17-4]